ncbi:MAG: transporter substrate-binding domain-containing protein [Desulfuromonadales bacterium]|nr:transporter substrate-binding domain-containing protein [Desulfuromonadales bacterium]
MKRITSILLAMMILSASIAAAATITVRADPWMPYDGDPKSDKPGYMIEVAEAIFAAKGHTIDFQNMPWTRCLDAVRKGTYDAVVGADDSEASGFIFPSQSFGVNKNGFYVKKGSSWTYAGVSSLAQVRLGIIDGYGYAEKLDEYIVANKSNSKKIFIAKGDDALPKLIKMVKAGRLDVVIDNANVMAHTLQGLGLENAVVQAGAADEVTDLYMAFSPAKASSKEYAKIFDQGLAELRSNGKLQKILSRYGLKDWK